VVRRFVYRSPFQPNADPVHISWKLSPDGQFLERVHISKDTELQAVHAKLCTNTGKLSTRILGSLPTMSQAIEICKFAIDESDPQDTRINVAFRFNNMSPLAISFPQCTTSPWQHTCGTPLPPSSHNKYQEYHKRLRRGIMGSELKDASEKLDKIMEEGKRNIRLLGLGEDVTQWQLDVAFEAAGANPADPKYAAAERMKELTKERDKANEELAKALTSAKEMLRNFDVEEVLIGGDETRNEMRNR
jgi:hypothetical protein